MYRYVRNMYGNKKTILYVGIFFYPGLFIRVRVVIRLCKKIKKGYIIHYTGVYQYWEALYY